MSKFSETISNKWNRIGKKTRRNIVAFVYIFVIVFVIVGLMFTYNSPDMAFDNKANDTVNPDKAGNNAIIDKTREVDIASGVADLAQLSVKNNVSERAISIYAKNEIAQTDEIVITKPILSITNDNNALTIYMSGEGENAITVATKFGLTPQTVKWANGLISDNIPVGSRLIIPVADGVVYVVKEGDTINNIAEKYKSSISAILSQNNIDGLSVGEMILLPEGVLPANERPGYVAYVNTTSTSYRGSSSYTLSIGTSRAGNNYSYGYCTWYAYNRRVELGLPAYRSLGNANTWDDRARAAGITVSRTPIAEPPFSVF
ncbi:LysM peptidoglycan-binding domain-containing protein [Ruminococcaceae bacterium OttesenSCG-928-A11]|nr:LysM peptidoglycan-binding domain-containing protein [Ruminococcaceae bacterium OttesenSCG-928-A11]